MQTSFHNEVGKKFDLGRGEVGSTAKRQPIDREKGLVARVEEERKRADDGIAAAERRATVAERRTGLAERAAAGVMQRAVEEATVQVQGRIDGLDRGLARAKRAMEDAKAEALNLARRVEPLSTAAASLAGAEAERDAAVASLAGAEAERDAAVASLAGAEAERDAGQKVLEGVVKERETAATALVQEQGQVATLTRALETMTEGTTQVVEKRDGLERKLGQVSAEVEREKQRATAAETANGVSEEALDLMREELDQAKADLTARTAALNAAETARTAAAETARTAERTAAETARTAERNAQAGKVKDAKEKQTAAETDLNAWVDRFVGVLRDLNPGRAELDRAAGRAGIDEQWLAQRVGRGRGGMDR